MFEHLQRVSFLHGQDRNWEVDVSSGDVGGLAGFLEALVYAIGGAVLLIGIVLLAMDLRLGAMTWR